MAAAEADVREQLDEVGAPHGRAVDEVLALAAAVQPARDRDLAEVELRQRAVLVVEEQLDLAVVGRRVAGRAGEEHVVGLLRAQLAAARRLPAAQSSASAMFDLPGAVRPDDDGDARLEAHLDRLGERLEAAQLDRSQVHARGRLRGAADAAAPRAFTRPGPSPGSGHATSFRPGRGGRPGRALDVRDQLVVALATDGLAARAIDFLGHRSSSSRSGILRGGEAVERLRPRPARRPSSSGPCRRPTSLAVDHRRARERAVVRRPLDVEHGVVDLPAPAARAPPGARSCGRRGSSARTRSGRRRRRRRRRRIGSNPCSRKSAAERGLEQRGEHVAVPREALELVRRRALLARSASRWPEPELARDRPRSSPARRRASGSSPAAPRRSPGSARRAPARPRARARCRRGTRAARTRTPGRAPTSVCVKTCLQRARRQLVDQPTSSSGRPPGLGYWCEET